MEPLAQRVAARYLQARDTEITREVMSLMDDVTKALQRAWKATRWGDQDPPDALASDLARKAEELRDVLYFHPENERLQRGIKKMEAKLRNFRKMLDEYTKANTGAELREVLRKQQTKSKYAWEKFAEYAHLVRDILRAITSEAEETMRMGPYTVTLFTSARRDWDKDMVEHLRWLLDKSQTVLGRIGMKSIAGGRVFAWPTSTLPAAAATGHSALASYQPSTDKINVAMGQESNDLLPSFIHELGHRAYFKLVAGRGRTAWTEFFESNQGAPNVDAFIHDWEDYANNPPPSDWDAQKYGRYLGYYAHHLKQKGDEEQLMWLGLLAQKLPIKENFNPLTGKPKGKEAPGLDQLEAKRNEAKVFLYPVTAYSGMSAEELFAETFQTWALQGPSKIAPLLQEAFKRTLPSFRTAMDGNPR